MKTNIYFIRHAESKSNVDPFFDGDLNELTEKGIFETEKVLIYFKNKDILDIFSSDELRSKQTASAIYIPKKPIILNFLKERSVNYSNINDYTYTENYESFKQRLIETKQFLQNLTAGNYIVVSHAIFLKAFISYILLNELSNEESINQISNHLIIDNISISKFIFNHDKNIWKANYINKKL